MGRNLALVHSNLVLGLAPLVECRDGKGSLASLSQGVGAVQGVVEDLWRLRSEFPASTLETAQGSEGMVERAPKRLRLLEDRGEGPSSRPL